MPDDKVPLWAGECYHSGVKLEAFVKKSALCLVLLVTCSAFALERTEKVIWSFGSVHNDGVNPIGSLVADRAGNMYGTTQGGGSNLNCAGYTTGGGCGTVFELSLHPDGTWVETILYNFCVNYSGTECLDGMIPEAGLVFDKSGNLYGTTFRGGAMNGGLVFMLSRPQFPGGTWAETVLYDFCRDIDCLDGATPRSQLVFDSLGNLYGTTVSGGDHHANDHDLGGVVFELSPNSQGWTENVLYNFCSLGVGTNFCPDGVAPYAGVTFDKTGNLYGTTTTGGETNSLGGGTVYELSPTSSGWTERVVLAFPNWGNGLPYAPVSFDPNGNLYSTTYSGGGLGSVFRLDVATGIEHRFLFNKTDGANPMAGLLVDPTRRLIYGTTTASANGATGLVFQISSSGKETILYQFCQQLNCADGQSPMSGVIEDRSGYLFGTTEFGGSIANGIYGAVFVIDP